MNCGRRAPFPTVSFFSHPRNQISLASFSPYGRRCSHTPVSAGRVTFEYCYLRVELLTERNVLRNFFRTAIKNICDIPRVNSVTWRNGNRQNQKAVPTSVLNYERRKFKFKLKAQIVDYGLVGYVMLTLSIISLNLKCQIQKKYVTNENMMILMCLSCRPVVLILLRLVLHHRHL